MLADRVQLTTTLDRIAYYATGDEARRAARSASQREWATQGGLLFSPIAYPEPRAGEFTWAVEAYDARGEWRGHLAA